MSTRILSLLASVASIHGEQPAPPVAPRPPGEALVGEWVLDLGQTHYGAGAERRRWERFTCQPGGATLRCQVVSERVGGRRVAGRFAAGPGDAPRPVDGVPGMDAVQLRTISATIADATFYFRGTPVFAYRAYRGTNGRSLTIVAVDPSTRAALTSVVVYTRR